MTLTFLLGQNKCKLVKQVEWTKQQLIYLFIYLQKKDQRKRRYVTFFQQKMLCRFYDITKWQDTLLTLG